MGPPIITVRKCINQTEYFRAACRDVQREVSLELCAGDSAADWQAVAREPTPSEAVMLTETIEQLMRDLDEREREILSLSLQGYTVQEISPRVHRSERTVQRLLERMRHELHRMQANGSSLGGN